MSSRHLASLLKTRANFITLRDIVFLVKTTESTTGIPNLFYTQHFLPDAKPLKAFIHGHDVTRFLVHRSNLTRYSYSFIAYAYSIDFSVLEVRQFFNGLNKVSNKRPDAAKLAERGIRIADTRRKLIRGSVEDSTSTAQTAQQLAAITQIPLDTTSPGWDLLKKMEAKPAYKPPSSYEHSKFKDPLIFATALKLLCSRAANFRFAFSKLELYIRLQNAGFDSSVLLDLKGYLNSVAPGFVTESGLRSFLNDMALQYGWIPTVSKSTRETTLNQSFTLGDQRVLGISNLEEHLFKEVTLLDAVMLCG